MTCTSCGQGFSTPTHAVSAAKIQTPETTEVRSWTSLPLLDVSKVPEDLDLIGGSNSEYQSWRIPASYFLPGGTLNYTQYKVASAVELPERQVVPVFIANDSVEPVQKAIARAGETATNLAVLSNNGEVTLMTSGFYHFARPHRYEVGATYYLSQTNAGEVISLKPSAGVIQPLFSVVDQQTISINIQLQ